MDTLFVKLFNMSVAAGWMILAVLLLRLLLKKSAALDSLSAVGIRGRSLDLSGIVSDRAFICRPGWTVHP